MNRPPHKLRAGAARAKPTGRSLAESQAMATQLSLTLVAWLFEQDRLLEAKARCLELLRATPKELEAWRLLGQINAALGDHQGVVDALVPVLQRQPQDWASALVLGQAFALAGAWDQALRHLQAIPLESPQWSRAQHVVAELLGQRARWGEAESIFRLLLAHDSSQAASWVGLIKALSRQGRLTEAAQYLDDWVRSAPNAFEPWRARGIFHSGWGYLSSAEHDLQRALHLDGGHADTYLALANVFHLQKKLSQAFEAVDCALAIDPHSSSAQERKAVLLLETGQFEEGWRLYQSRSLPSRNFGQKPMWLGDEPIAGKTILVHCEQGLGDQIQFVRYLAPLAQLGAQVILLIDRSLKRLCATLAGASEVNVEGDALPPFDVHCPLLSLPLALRAAVPDIPGQTPYLQVEEALVRRWAQRLGPQKAFRVGLVWSGGVRPHLAEYSRMLERRNIPFAKLAGWAGLDVEFVGLQKGLYAAAEAMELGGADSRALNIVNLGEEFVDFADTAAVIKNLDLVVSVDTAVAHLAGALNVPVWILNRFDSCWRWLSDRADSPWYPSARLYRQVQFDDWQPVLEQVQQDLAEQARQWREQARPSAIAQRWRAHSIFGDRLRVCGLRQPRASSLEAASANTLDSAALASLEARALEAEVDRVLSALGTKGFGGAQDDDAANDTAGTINAADFLVHSNSGFAQSNDDALLVAGGRAAVGRDTVAGFVEFLANSDALEWDLMFPEVTLKSLETVRALADVANNLNLANELTVLNLADFDFDFDFERDLTVMIRRTSLEKVAPYLASTATIGGDALASSGLPAAIANGSVAAFCLFPFLPGDLARGGRSSAVLKDAHAALYRHSLNSREQTATGPQEP